jgi:hypothetical protein
VLDINISKGETVVDISLLLAAVELTTIVFDLLSGSDNPTGWNSRIAYKDYIDK